MRSVSRFETSLLSIVEGLLGRVPLAQALPLMLRPHPRPKCLSRGAVELVQGYLSKGVVSLLARSSWQGERFLRSGEVSEGRLWERTAPEKLALRYSANSLDFLIWLTAMDPLVSKDAWEPRQGVALTLGDRLVLLLAYQAVRNADFSGARFRCEPWISDGVCTFNQPAECGPAENRNHKGGGGMRHASVPLKLRRDESVGNQRSKWPLIRWFNAWSIEL